MEFNKVIEQFVAQGAQVWLSKLSRQRNFYMSSFLRDISQLSNHMQDMQASNSSSNDMSEVLKALTGAKPKADTNVIDYDKLADKVAERLSA